MAVSSIAHNADIDATRLISTAPARRKEANIMNMRVKEAYSRDGSECQYQYVGEAGKELCTILPNPSRIKNDDAKLIDKIGFIIVTTLDKFRHKRAYDNSHITGLMMDEIAALMQPFSCCQENDGELLDWLQSIMTPMASYCEVFFAGLRDGNNDATSFQIEINPEVFPTTANV
jgi:hypothetical protein